MTATNYAYQALVKRSEREDKISSELIKLADAMFLTSKSNQFPRIVEVRSSELFCYILGAHTGRVSYPEVMTNEEQLTLVLILLQDLGVDYVPPASYSPEHINSLKDVTL